MQYVIQAVPWGSEMVDYLVGLLPSAHVCYDDTGNIIGTLIRSMLVTEGQPYVLLKGDAYPCQNFEYEVEKRVFAGPGLVHQFFSGQSIYNDKSKVVLGSTYLWAQCTYFPQGVGPDFAGWMAREPQHTKYTTEYTNGIDYAIAEYLKTQGMKYVRWSPSPVQHRGGVSAIDRRPPRKRHTPYFLDDVKRG